MEYEKTILNLLERIATLEERVYKLEGEKIQNKKPRGYYTDIVKKQIISDINKAKQSGESNIVLTSGGIQREVGLKNRLPLVCNAMRECMDEKSKVIYETPSGQSSTLAIQWNWEGQGKN